MPGMARGADRLDARLLDRFEHGARILAFRAIVMCGAVIVIGEAQRHRNPRCRG